MPITIGDIVNALDALGGEAHYSAIADYIIENGQQPFPEDPHASVRARLQERCSDYKAYKGQADLFESEPGSGIWRFRTRRPDVATSAFDEERSPYQAHEGALVPKTHFIRERDPKLVAEFKASLSSLNCEACDTNFGEIYGALGMNYIEAHHKIPIAMLAEDAKTSIDDLAALCPNCHRVIHRNYPMSVEELRGFVTVSGGFVDSVQIMRSERKTWKEAVEAAIIRLVSQTGKSEFTRQDLIRFQLQNIVDDVASKGETPEQTLSRVLQELKQSAVIEFVDNQGVYRLK